MTTLAELIAEYGNRSEPIKIATRWLDEGDRDDIIAALTDAVQSRMRLSALATERAAFRQHPTFVARLRNRSKNKTGDVLGPFADLRKQKFTPSRGVTPVTWDRATRTQHLQRIAALITLRGGIDETIRQHEAAVALLDQYGVDRLADIKAQAA